MSGCAMPSAILTGALRVWRSFAATGISARAFKIPASGHGVSWTHGASGKTERIGGVLFKTGDEDNARKAYQRALLNLREGN